VRSFFIAVLLLLVLRDSANAQDDERTKYPFGISDSFIEFNFGYIHHQFSEEQLEPDFRVESVLIPHSGVRLGLGHNFNKYFSAQLVYMRPVRWVQYKNVTGSGGVPSGRSVFTNIAGLTARVTLPVKSPLSLYGEGGLGIITRRGFEIGGKTAVKDADYLAPVIAAGFKYRLNNKWDLQAGLNYSPPNKNYLQPHTLMFSTGGVLNMRNSPDIPSKSVPGVIFPEHLIQVGYSTNSFGMGANRLVSEKIPVFWGGDVEAGHGMMLIYQRNIYHTKKIFSFDWGLSISRFRSAKNGNNFSTISIFPQFRFTPVRSKFVDPYLTYSLAGPAYLFRNVIDNINTGKNFTFQDMMGVGFYFGKNKHANLEMRIGHYSNGNIFPDNPGIKIPLTIMLGYAF
jgi:hypothetical protein